MNRIYKSGAQKRKEAASSRQSPAKLTNLRRYFLVAQADRPRHPCWGCNRTTTSKMYSTSPSRVGRFRHLRARATLWFFSNSKYGSAERKYKKCCRCVINIIYISTTFNQSVFEWPNLLARFISNAQRCVIVKKGPQEVDTNFPLNAARRRFSTFHYRRVMNNGEIVPRSWLIYSQETDKAFCFFCKLFSNSKSTICTSSNTWKGIAKKLKGHENKTAHKKCFSDWMLLREKIRSHSMVDKQEMEIFLSERTFWRNVLERLIDIVIFLAKKL